MAATALRRSARGQKRRQDSTTATDPRRTLPGSLVDYGDADGNQRIVETTTSWCYVGAGLRLTMELLGPEYSMELNSLDAGPRIFFSR